MNYKNHGYSKMLTPKCNNSGRLWVELIYNGKKRCALIHRLVGEAFIPNPNNFPQINHMDENPKNNRWDNLEWCTAAYNNKYFRDRHPELIRRTSFPTGEEWKKIHGNSVSKDFGPVKMIIPVNQISKETGKVLKSWDNIYTVWKTNGWKTSSIKGCCEGVRKSAYGYIWQYASDIDGREIV
jgi:hypothetical protein